MNKRIGASISRSGGCEFCVWAPFCDKVELELLSPKNRKYTMEKDEPGYWSVAVEDAKPGTRYRFVLNLEKERPDPASHYQPDGVHSPSEVVDHSVFEWDDHGWQPHDLSSMIIYELHTGTFTDEGNFDAAVKRLDQLADLGVNSIEIMPVAQFPGERNWGYDGVYPFAVQNSYGGPSAFKRFVNECHKRNFNVILDVVYNHLGPEGNYLWDYGPYFTGRYVTPWGDALNFDGKYSDEVRNFFIKNALHWLGNYHVDALRLDAVHAIYDMTAVPFLRDLVDEVKKFSEQTGKRSYLIAESALNDPRIIRPVELGGYGYDAQWSDDLHHSVHSVLTGESHGYYQDYGGTGDIVKSLREGFAYSGQYSKFRKRKYGNSSADRPARQFVVFTQNHDQIGNRGFGKRLSSLVGIEGIKVAAGIVLMSPYIPLLFMGEEYGELSPFLYFVSHNDPELVQAVREGRKAEFSEFTEGKEPPDPHSEDTFRRSILKWGTREDDKHGRILDYYRELINLRKVNPALKTLSKESMSVTGFEVEKLLYMKRWCSESHEQIHCMFNLDSCDHEIHSPFRFDKLEKIIDSADTRWGGPGSCLPDALEKGKFINLRSTSMAVYRSV